MMSYRVVQTDHFDSHVGQQVEYLLSERVSIETIQQWIERLYLLIANLSEWPHRYPVDPIYTKETGTETRKANYGDYLIFYQVDDKQKVVHMVAFIHGARRGSGDWSD